MATKIIILAAGMGKRLEYLTNILPKCLVEIGGKPILSWQIEVLTKFFSIDDITIVTGFQSEKVNNLYPNLKQLINYKYKTTNMVFSLFCAKSNFTQNTDDIIIIYGDILFDIKVAEKIFFDNTDQISLISLCEFNNLWTLRMSNPLEDLESYKMDKNGLVYEIGSPVIDITSVEGQFTGIIKINKSYTKQFYEIWTKINDDKKDNMYMTDFIRLLISKGWKIKSVPIINGWLEVDTIFDVNLYNSLISSQKIKNYINLGFNQF